VSDTVSDALRFDEAERLLLEAEFLDCRELWFSSNYVYIAQLQAGEETTFAAVYKPESGESPLWDFPSGELYKREVAAYRLARLLDWPLIPPTVMRDGPRGVGAVQVFIRHEKEHHFFQQREVPELVPQLKRMAAFDFIANNADRKGGHCLLDEQGQIWGIDHGLCFHEEYKLRSVIWDWADEPIQAEWLKDIKRVLRQVDLCTDEARPLLELLSGRESAALLRRLKTITETGRLPLPGPHRSYPWPLV
jgi:uncharacterized repeat protein (TIGR03843 family)